LSYKKPKNEQEFVKLFKYISLKEFNWECNVPVLINPRMYSFGGKYFAYLNNGIPEVVKFEFNINNINGVYPLKTILNTIRHELVHWYSDKTTQKRCKHNDIFIENCKKFGVTDNTDFERYKPRKRLSNDNYHEAKCLGCDRVVAKCKSMSNLKKFMNRYGGTVCSCNFGKRYILDKGVKHIYYHGERYGTPEHWLDYDCFTKDMKIIFCKEEGEI
jgi:hypothetical protein